MAKDDPTPTIVRTSPARADSRPDNPRRPTAEQSVSLRHAQAKEPTASSTDPGTSTSNGSPSSLIPLTGGSSGESSNAERWFEKSNNEVRDNDTKFTDNDPPFFLRNNSSASETPPERPPMLQNLPTDDRANSLPLQMLRLGGTDAGSTDDFRSVIDDLTVENKKLKRKLKKYEKLHDSHLKDQKLFEVRIHGLPAEKRRELEETLRKFASDMDTTGANAFPSNGYASVWPTLKTQKTASSSTSLQNTDSAYASMSASGQGSSRQSGNDAKAKLTPKTHLASRQQNIRNYLHDIPQGLLPQQNPATLSERAKRKLVVRRMEQLFAGKGAGSDGHQQSIQQQEVSQIAAQADRHAFEAAGQRARLEGHREANIMQGETEDPADPQPSTQSNLKIQPNESHDTGRSPAQDQRPTRPLDLDPHRAQVPRDNIQYMRRLGFSPKDPRSSESPEEGHGWVYLNFLINMAQLHTINVTSDFVRNALSDLSGKFEISNDGRKVRWRGGRSVTRSSSSRGGQSSDRTENSTSDGQSPRKRAKLSHTEKTRSFPTSVFGGASRGPPADSGKHAYTPMFHHRDSTDDSDDSSYEIDNDDDSSYFPAQPVAGDSSGMTSSGIRTTSGMYGAPKKRSQRNDDGPIIFYNNARFCTDLSGDRKAVANKNIPAYNKASSTPIGKQRSLEDEIPETKGPLAQASALPEPMDLDDNPIPESMELSFPQRSPLGSDSEEEQSPIELEVTGIGGVWPADNFAISVESRHARVDQATAPSIAPNAIPKIIPARFAKILHGPNATTRCRGAVYEHFTVAERKELLPSELPPPLGFMPDGDGSSGDDDESDADDAMSDVPESIGEDPPEAAPQPVELHYLSDDEDEEEEEDSDYESDDGEVDFLAAARQMDPEAVRQKEREYDANIAERLADEIPAGSSAATAGGGSGFASPAEAMDKEKLQRAARESRVQAANLERLRAKEAESGNHADIGAEDGGEVSDVSS